MNRFVIADSTMCIGCRTCEIACVVAHSDSNHPSAITPQAFAPRLRVMKTFDVSSPILCRQCENAPCANNCPNGAIIYGADSVQVLQSLCIGCKTCMVVCPYGAMSIVPKAVPTGTDTVGATRAVEAHKCDLCKGRSNGPACVEVCPTSALRLIGPETLQAMMREKQQRAALGDVPGIMG